MALADWVEQALVGVYRGGAAIAKLVRARKAAQAVPTMAETRRKMEADQDAQAAELRRVLNERSTRGPT